jgi:AcrR family transcriptional regulator
MTVSNGTRTSARERQASIISAAAALFAAKGFNGTTTREIAKTAGISEALLFKYFPTKRALYAAILAEKVQISQLMDSVEAAAEKRDDARVFTLIASFRIHRGADPTLLRLLLFSALEGHELSDMFFRKRHRVFYEYLAGYIGDRCREGAFRCLDPLLAAQAFVGMIVYHRLLHEIFKVPLHCTPEEAVAAYVEVFLSGLRSGREEASQWPGR